MPEQMRTSLNIALWVVSGLLAALFMAAGVGMLIGLTNEQFIEWGYTPGFAPGIGILEMAGALGLLFKRTAGWSALGLIAITLGALWTLAIHHWYVALIAPIAVLALLLFVAWGRGLTFSTKASEPGSDALEAPVANPHEDPQISRTRSH